MQSEASLGVCEDEPSETRLRCCRINDSPVKADKSAPAEPERNHSNIVNYSAFAASRFAASSASAARFFVSASALRRRS